ncbi:MAG: hypothetical protein RLZ13_1335 [Bacteroidota bacterium]|jgi:hypothetical protein
MQSKQEKASRNAAGGLSCESYTNLRNPNELVGIYPPVNLIS